MEVISDMELMNLFQNPIQLPWPLECTPPESFIHAVAQVVCEALYSREDVGNAFDRLIQKFWRIMGDWFPTCTPLHYTISVPKAAWLSYRLQGTPEYFISNTDRASILITLCEMKFVRDVDEEAIQFLASNSFDPPLREEKSAVIEQLRFSAGLSETYGMLPTSQDQIELVPRIELNTAQRAMLSADGNPLVKRIALTLIDVQDPTRAVKQVLEEVASADAPYTMGLRKAVMLCRNICATDIERIAVYSLLRKGGYIRPCCTGPGVLEFLQTNLMVCSPTKTEIALLATLT